MSLRPERQFDRSVWLRLGLLVLVITAAFWFASQALDIVRTSGFTDFDILFHSAQRLAAGHSPYLRGLLNAPFGGYYKFPPLVDQLLAPLTQFDWLPLARAYAVAGLMFYLAAFLLLARIQKFDWLSVPMLLLALAFLVFQPALDTLNGPQHEFLILLLFSIAYWGLLRAPRGEWAAGVALAIPILIKLYPILIVPYFLLRRAWRALAALFATLVGLTLLSGEIGGWDLQRQFWFVILPSLSGATAWLENQSFFAFFARLFVNGATADPIRVTVVPLATWLSYGAILVSLSVSAAALWRDSRPQFAFAIGVPLVLLIGPNSWIHYETLLLLPLAILLGEFWNGGASRAQWLLLAVATALCAFGNEETVRSTTLGLVQSYKFLGVLLFWLLALRWAWAHAPDGFPVPQFITRARLRRAGVNENVRA